MKPAAQIQEPRLLIANQKKHINSLNRFIWMLINAAGGEVRIPHREMVLMPDGWKFSIEPDPNKPDEIVFKATTDAPDKGQQTITA